MPLQLQDLLQGQVPEEMFELLDQKLEGADRARTSQAISDITTMLTTALSQNASNEQGVQSLVNALDRDHDGSILDDFAGLLKSQVADEPSKTLDGAGILGHILGNRLGSSVDVITETSGLEKVQVGRLMQTLAPIVMGILGKSKREQGLDIGGLTEMINNIANSESAQKNPAIGMITKLLDRNGDGNAMDDIAKMSINMLSQLFKKK